MASPRFTAEAALYRSSGRYAHRARSATSLSGVSPQLVALPICKFSPCMSVGNCKIRVRCCRNFFGRCQCSTIPCGIVPLGVA